MNSTIYYGNINLSKLITALKNQHPSAFKSEKTGDIYINVNLFISENPDQFKNHGSICTSQKVEDKEKGFYFGNFKKSEARVISQDDLNNLNVDDLPF